MPEVIWRLPSIGEREGNNTPFFLIPTILVGGVLFFILPFNLFVAMALASAMRAARGLHLGVGCKSFDEVCAAPDFVGGIHYVARSPTDLRARGRRDQGVRIDRPIRVALSQFLNLFGRAQGHPDFNAPVQCCYAAVRSIACSQAMIFQGQPLARRQKTCRSRRSQRPCGRWQPRSVVMIASMCVPARCPRSSPC